MRLLVSSGSYITKVAFRRSTVLASAIRVDVDHIASGRRR